MGLGYQKSRRHAAGDRRIKANLALHDAWMKHFESEGMNRTDASAAAFKKVKAGETLPVTDWPNIESRSAWHEWAAKEE